MSANSIPLPARNTNQSSSQWTINSRKPPHMMPFNWLVTGNGCRVFPYIEFGLGLTVLNKWK